MKLTYEDKYQAAKTAVALDKFVEKYNLTGLAYYYEGRDDSLHRKVATTFIVGNSILNAQVIQIQEDSLNPQPRNLSKNGLWKAPHITMHSV